MRCSLWFELTPYCNLDCSFCYNPWRARPASRFPGRTQTDWLSVASRLCSKRIFDYVALSGGEPLLYPQLPELIAELSAARQSVIVTTNGRVATEARLRRLTASGLDGLQVPLLAMDPDIHDALSGRRSWSRAVSGILVARKLGLSVALTFVATSRNVHDLPRVVGFAAEVGIRDVVFNEVHLQGNARFRDDLAPAASACMATLDQARAVAPAVTVHVRPHSRELREMLRIVAGPVGGPWHRLAVDPDGKLKLCNQSERTIAGADELTEPEIAGLLGALEAGDLMAFRDQTDNCSCLDTRLVT